MASALEIENTLNRVRRENKVLKATSEQTQKEVMVLSSELMTQMMENEKLVKQKEQIERRLMGMSSSRMKLRDMETWEHTTAVKMLARAMARLLRGFAERCFRNWQGGVQGSKLDDITYKLGRSRSTASQYIARQMRLALWPLLSGTRRGALARWMSNLQNADHEPHPSASALRALGEILLTMTYDAVRLRVKLWKSHLVMQLSYNVRAPPMQQWEVLPHSGLQARKLRYKDVAVQWQQGYFSRC